MSQPYIELIVLSHIIFCGGEMFLLYEIVVSPVFIDHVIDLDVQ